MEEDDDDAGSTGAGGGAPYQDTGPSGKRERGKKSVRILKMDDQNNRFRNPREYSQAYHSLPWWWRPDVVVEFSHVVIVGLEIRK